MVTQGRASHAGHCSRAHLPTRKQGESPLCLVAAVDKKLHVRILWLCMLLSLVGKLRLDIAGSCNNYSMYSRSAFGHVAGLLLGSVYKRL